MSGFGCDGLGDPVVGVSGEGELLDTVEQHAVNGAQQFGDGPDSDVVGLNTGGLGERLSEVVCALVVQAAHTGAQGGAVGNHAGELLAGEPGDRV